MRIGIFGGTFDPIHLGHLSAAEDALEILELDRVLFVPNRVPPHKQQGVSPVEDRVAMVELATADNERFAVSLMELERAGPSYTLDTLRELRRHYPGIDLIFLVGCDALPALHTWHEPRQLLEEFPVVVLDRPTGKWVDWEALERHFPAIRRQVRVIHVAQLDISGEDIRRRVEAGRSVRYQVTPAVDRYIRCHGLYRRARNGGVVGSTGA